MAVKSFRRTRAPVADGRSTSISCETDFRPPTGSPASSATSIEMSWPARMPSGMTGGEMCEASGTRSVSGDVPPPFGGAAVAAPGT